MRVGIAFDLRSDFEPAADAPRDAPPGVPGDLPSEVPDDLFEEFDSVATVDAIASALE